VVGGPRRLDRRSTEASQRQEERRQREVSAPRLAAAAPSLEALSIELSDTRGVADPAVTHIRRVVVSHAPALFEVACIDASCKEGGHDLTRVILGGLQAQRTTIDGQDVCHGYVRDAHCGRTLRFVATAKFRSS